MICPLCDVFATRGHIFYTGLLCIKFPSIEGELSPQRERLFVFLETCHSRAGGNRVFEITSICLCTIYVNCKDRNVLHLAHCVRTV